MKTSVMILRVVLVVALITSVRAAPGSTCNGSQLICQLRAGVINCSRNAGAAAAAGPVSEVATFVQDDPTVRPSSVSLRLPEGPGAVSLANLDGLAACFPVSYEATMRLVAGSAAVRLVPGCLDALAGVQRLTLRLRFQGDRVPGGVFTARLASLRNLQLESPGIVDIDVGAFKELRRLRRLFISNLRMPRLTAAFLQGLGDLRVLELPANRLRSLDAASFAASPRLELIDLSTRSPEAATVAPDAFCSLPRLRQLQYPTGLGLTCSGFASRKVQLMPGPDAEPRDCILDEGSPCGGSAGVHVIATTTVAMTATKTSAVTTSTAASTSTTVSTSTRTTAVTTLSTQAATQSTTTATMTRKPRTTSTAHASEIKTEKTTAASSVWRGPEQPAAAGGSGAAGGRPALVAVALVAVALVLLGAAVAILVATRGRRFGLRRAQSRQPIFTAGSSIDMQDSLWNPTFQPVDPAEPIRGQETSDEMQAS